MWAEKPPWIMLLCTVRCLCATVKSAARRCRTKTYHEDCLKHWHVWILQIIWHLNCESKMVLIDFTCVMMIFCHSICLTWIFAKKQTNKQTSMWITVLISGSKIWNYFTVMISNFMFTDSLKLTCKLLGTKLVLVIYYFFVFLHPTWQHWTSSFLWCVGG